MFLMCSRCAQICGGLFALRRALQFSLHVVEIKLKTSIHSTHLPLRKRMIPYSLHDEHHTRRKATSSTQGSAHRKSLSTDLIHIWNTSEAHINSRSVHRSKVCEAHHATSEVPLTSSKEGEQNEYLLYIFRQPTRTSTRSERYLRNVKG